MLTAVRQRLLLPMALLIVCLGCSGDPPRNIPTALDSPTADLLKRLTAVDEAVRFEVLETAGRQIGHVSAKQVETVLTALRPKNVSTLIYVCIQTKSRLLFGLSPAAQMTLEYSTGSFPNLAYYLARVDPAAGLPLLLDLYERHPDHRMAICRAIGEVCHPEAADFLLDQVRRIKSAGGDIVSHLAGLHHNCTPLAPETIDWLLGLHLDREETIALSHLDLKLPPQRLKTLWQAGDRSRFLAVELILGAPQLYFDLLRWMVDQHLKAGEDDTVRRLMYADALRSVSDRRLIEFREAILKEVGQPVQRQESSP